MRYSGRLTAGARIRSSVKVHIARRCQYSSFRYVGWSLTPPVVPLNPACSTAFRHDPRRYHMTLDRTLMVRCFANHHQPGCQGSGRTPFEWEIGMPKGLARRFRRRLGAPFRMMPMYFWLTTVLGSRSVLHTAEIQEGHRRHRQLKKPLRTRALSDRRVR